MSRFISGLMVVLFLALPAVAQELSKEAAAATVDATVRFIQQNYVFPDKVGAITARIRESRDAGRYAVSDAAQLAQRLTQDMQTVTTDKHMNVQFDPPRAATLMAMQSQTAPGPGGGGFFANMMRTTNFGIPKLEILPGNVRYVSLAPAFLWDNARSPQAIDHAMRFLDGGDAYIIDIRSNMGGSPDSVRYVISHFMDPGTKLMTYRLGPEGTTESRSEKVTMGRLPAKPLYVLTAPNSASAAEEFAAHVKNFKLGTLVGAKTAGAGNRNQTYGTPEGFVVSVSVGTAIHPVTNTGWEGTGIAPDIAVAPSVALETAHLDALKKVRNTSDKKAEIDRLIEVISAKLQPPRITEPELRVFIGTYGDDRKVSLRDGKLYWHFGPGEFELVFLGKDRFAFVSGPAITLQFNRDGQKVAAVTEVTPNGKQNTFARSSS